MAIIRLISMVQEKDYSDDDLEYKQLHSSSNSDTASSSDNVGTYLLKPSEPRGKARQYSQVRKKNIKSILDEK